MMCYVCNSYYDRVHRKNIETLLVCAATGILSMNGLNSNQESVLINLFDSQDNICLALKIAKERIVELNDKLSKMSKYANNRFFIESDVNNYCDFVLMAEITLKEYEEGISYYFDNCQEYDNEIVLYRALKIVEWF